MKKNVRVILVMALIVVMVFGAFGCSGGGNGGDAATETPAASVDAPAESESPAAATESAADTGDVASSEPAAAWSLADETDKVVYEDWIKEVGELDPADVPEGLSIGAVLCESTNEYWTALGAGMEKGAEKYGVDIDVQYQVDINDRPAQIALGEASLAQDYDAYIFSPLVDGLLDPVADLAHQNGKYVVNSVCLTVNNADNYFGADQYVLGQLCGEYAAQKIKDRGETPKAIIAMGTVGTEMVTSRTNGFKDAFIAAGGEVVQEMPCDWSAETAMNMTFDALTADPSVNVVFANNDNMALGCVEAVRNQGRTDDVLTLGVDAITAGVDSIKSGGLTASVNYFTEETGVRSVEMAVRALMGQDVPRAVIGPAVVVDKDNVNEYFAD